MSIVAVERSRTVPSVATMRGAGIPVVAGDATDAGVLARAGIEHASRVVWTGNDWIDGQGVVAAAMALMRRESERPGTRRSRDTPLEAVPVCLVRVHDLSLCSDLRRRALADAARGGSNAGPDVDYFNESENVAQRMLWKATRSYALADSPSATLMVVGTGVLAEALIVQAARQWLGRRADHNETHRLSVHVFADDAPSEVRRICALWPGRCRVLDRGTRRPSRNREPMRDTRRRGLRRRRAPGARVGDRVRLVDETEIPCIVVTIDERARRLFGSDRVLTFDPIADGLECDELLFDSYELMARMAHTHYLEQHAPLPEGVEPDNPTHEWHDLNEFWRASNRDAARFVIPNLVESGFAIVTLRGRSDGSSAFEPAVVDALAGREHERWRSFMTRCGWSHGPTRDDAQRRRPDLVPWPEARAESRSYTSDYVRTYPRLLMQLGYDIQRRSLDPKAAGS